MRLLITTMIKVVYWDGKPNTIHEGDLGQGCAHYNGITWDKSSLYISGAHDFVYCIYQLDPRTFQERRIFFGDLHETHQIFYLNGNLYCVNTGKNRIDIWDGRLWSWVAFNKSPHDVDHLNGIWSDGERFYVSEFRDKTGEPSAIRVCNMDLSLNETIEMGDPIHNVYMADDTYYSLASRRPGLVCRDRHGLHQQSLPQLEGMLLRGLARSPDNWFVGASRWETDRNKRHVGDALVVILDNNLVEVDRIEIKDAGPVCGIRLIEPMDLAHNGIAYPGI